MPSLAVIHIVDVVGEHFDDRAIDAVFEQTPSLVIWSSFGCLSPHSEGATIVKLKHISHCNAATYHLLLPQRRAPLKVMKKRGTLVDNLRRSASRIMQSDIHCGRSLMDNAVGHLLLCRNMCVCLTLHGVRRVRLEYE